MINFYIYDMGIIDFFAGMVSIHDYIRLLCKEDDYDSIRMGEDYLTYKELKTFMVKAFTEVMITGCGWDGDVTCAAISAIPQPTAQAPFKILAFKQSNNGQSFMVSECRIFIDYESDFEKKWINHIKDFDKRDLFLCFDHAYDLVEKIFSEALKKPSQAAPPLSVSQNHNTILLCKPTAAEDFEKIG